MRNCIADSAKICQCQPTAGNVCDAVIGLRQDAERYRKVRRGQHWSVVDGIGDVLRGGALDAAIDALPAVG